MFFGVGSGCRARSPGAILFFDRREFPVRMEFTHLHVHSHYSLLDGGSSIDNLVSCAQAHGMKSLALTDHGNLFGAVEFYRKARKAGIRPILGMEAYIAPGHRGDRGAG